MGLLEEHLFVFEPGQFSSSGWAHSNPGGYGGFMNKCKLCNEEAKPDEWANYDKKICINCESDNNGYFNTRTTSDEPKETNQQ